MIANFVRQIITGGLSIMIGGLFITFSVVLLFVLAISGLICSASRAFK
jgi:hypothetical protein